MPLFISLCSNSLRSPRPSSPPSIYRPTRPRLPWAQYQNPQNSSTWSQPRRDLPSADNARFRTVPDFSFSHCSPLLAIILYFFWVYWFRLIGLVPFALRLNLFQYCLPLASVSCVSCSP